MLQSTVTEPPPRTGGDERADGPARGSPLSGDIGARRARLGLLTEPAPGARLAELSTAAPILTAPPEVLVGRSAELLRRWPDVRRAVRQLAAATARSGVATAKQFVHEGAYVFITGRREPELAAAVKEIGSHGTGVQGDVSHLGDLDRLFAHPDEAGNGEYLPLVGDFMSFNEVVDTLNRQGHKFSFKQVPKEVFAALFPGAAEMAEMFSYFQAHTYLGSDSYDRIAFANKIAGRQPTKFSTWARLHVPIQTPEMH